MTIHACATQLLSALRSERATPAGSLTQRHAQRETDEAADRLAAELADLDRLLADIHQHRQQRRA